MKKSLLFVFGCLLAIGLYAQEAEVPAVEQEQQEHAAPVFEATEFGGDWSINVGLSYRDFKRPKFGGATSPSFTGYVFNEATGEFSAPSDATLGAAWAARNYTSGATGVGRLTFGDFGGASISGKGTYGNADQTAPAVGFSTSIWSKDQFDVAFVGNFQFFSMDSGDKMVGSGDTKCYDLFVGKKDGHYLVNQDSQQLPSTATGNTDLKAFGSSKFDMQLYVFDIGLSLGYNFDNGVRAFVAAGPSLSLADMETSSRISIGSGDSRKTLGGRANEVEFNWGLYASAGAGYWFSEAVGLTAELRYDKGFGDVGTRYVSQSLNTLGGQLKLQFRF